MKETGRGGGGFKRGGRGDRCICLGTGAGDGVAGTDADDGLDVAGTAGGVGFAGEVLRGVSADCQGKPAAWLRLEAIANKIPAPIKIGGADEN